MKIESEKRKAERLARKARHADEHRERVEAGRAKRAEAAAKVDDRRADLAALRDERAATRAARTPRTRVLSDREVGDARIVCPNCQTVGQVVARRVKVKRGVSGGKATGAVLTAGVSILATGLSRKDEVTEAHCGNCRTGWTF